MLLLAEDFITANAQLFSIALATIVCVATVVYAVLTYKLVNETRRSREALTEPHIVVYLDKGFAGIHFYDCVIRNVGNGAAYNVRFEILREDLLIDGKESLKPLHIFKHGLRFIPPDFEHRFYFASVLGKNFEKAEEAATEVVVNYSTKDGRQKQETFILDFRHLPGLTYLGTPPLEELARSAKKIKEVIERLTTYDGLKVVSTTQDDLAKASEEREEEWKRRRIWKPGEPED